MRCARGWMWMTVLVCAGCASGAARSPFPDPPPSPEGAPGEAVPPSGEPATPPDAGVAEAGRDPEPDRTQESAPPPPEVDDAETLGEIEPVDGPLAIRVTYPTAGQRITAYDSNFVFGSLGTGRASLTIDGHPVRVEPNGAFLAWLPVPTRSSGDTGTYRITARRDSDTVAADLSVILPAVRPLGHRGPWVASPFGQLTERWVLPGDQVTFEVRAEAGLDVWLEVPLATPTSAPTAQHVILAQAGEPAASGAPVSYRGAIQAAALRRLACFGTSCPPAFDIYPGDLLIRVDSIPLELRATDGRDTLGLRGTLPLALLGTGTLTNALPAVELREGSDPVNGLSGSVVGRPTPFGTYRWLFPDGTRAHVTGRLGDRLRIRLATGLGAWVLNEDVRWIEGAIAEPRAYDLRVEPLIDRARIRLGIDGPVPVDVRQPDDRTLEVTLFGALAETERMAYGPTDRLIEGLGWRQVPEGIRLRVRLSGPVWGYRLGWREGDARAYEGPRPTDRFRGGAVLWLDVRRPPRIDPGEPLRGRRIAIDPGHPGAGSTGPAGLFEGDANLAVARRLADLLSEEGATPILIRQDRGAIGLYDRTSRAIAAGADLFVSIHNNALPDGLRPFGRAGSSTYYYHPHSRGLAREVQRGLVREMGLRDLGMLWGNLAVTRMSEMPAVLAEGAFMMIPSHEAALATPEFQTRYARGVLEGVRRFLESRARGQAAGRD